MIDGSRLRACLASNGLSVSTLLDESGIPAGAPVPTLDGRSVVDLDDASLALLTWVEGEPLTGSDADEQHVIGETLARQREGPGGRPPPALLDRRILGTRPAHRPAAPCPPAQR